MNRLVPVAVTAALIVATAVTLLVLSNEDGASITFDTVEQGAYASHELGGHPPELRIIRTQDEWAAFWEGFRSDRFPPPERPPVDFSREAVIGLLDAHGSGGYSVTIDRIEARSDRWVVHATHTEPCAGCGVTLLLTQPHHIVRLPRFDGNVTLVVTEVVSPCPDEGKIWLSVANLVSELRVHEIVESLNGEIVSRHGNSHIVTNPTGANRFYTGKSTYSISVPKGNELELVPQFEAFPEILSAEFLCDSAGTRG